MPSPFPGMDPYIESTGEWGDFHGSTLSAIRAELNARLPKGYVASTELYVWTREAESRGRARAGEPDVYVREEGVGGRAAKGAAAVAAPATIVLPRLERRKRRYIKVEDVRAKRVVTVLELLSPSNKKSGNDRSLYLERRSGYLASPVSFVEIDLLRGGRRPPLGKRQPDVSDYYVMVSRSWDFPIADFWTFGIRDPLPEVPVPVTRELGDTPLNLRRCVDRAYDEGRYADGLPYGEPLKPRPRDEDAAWVRDVLAARPSE